jgi:hypothetical protein
MAKDYIPTPKGDLKQWLINLKKSVNDMGAQVGLSPGEISEGLNLCDEYIAQIDSTEQARIHAKSQVSAKKAMLKTHQPRLRHLISKMKTSMNKGNAKAFKLMANKQELDEATYKPHFRLKATGDHIEVKFKKRGIAGMQFKVKIGPDLFSGEWTDLGLRLHSPMKFKPEGYPQGSVLRVWFIAVAIIKDEHFGQWSDASSVVFIVE